MTGDGRATPGGRPLVSVLPLVALVGSPAPAMGDVPHAGTFGQTKPNYLCAQRAGEGSYPLPCRSPREDWVASPLLDTFVITAWWPPTMNVMHEYAAAHFNLVMTGALPPGCQMNKTIPTPATTNDEFECIAHHLPALRELGLFVTFDLGNTLNRTGLPRLASVLGGSKAYGGVTESGPGGYLTAPEVAWAVQELQRRNLSDMIHQVFLHDDDTAPSQAVTDSVTWLRENAPTITPITNTFPDSGGPEGLYAGRQYIFSPEEYSVTDIEGQTGTDFAYLKTQAQLVTFANNEYLTQRYRLDAWPLFAMMDGLPEPGENGTAYISDSLVRVQVYSALAFGVRALNYYCWGSGVWAINRNKSDTFGGQFTSPGVPGPNYNTVKAANADAMVWGTLLLKAKPVGNIRAVSSSFNTSAKAAAALAGTHSTAPGDGLPITDMPTDVLAGAFIAANRTSGVELPGGGQTYLLVVDTRSSLYRSTQPGASLRSIQITLGADCADGAKIVPGGKGGWSEQHTAIIAGRQVSLSLTAGAGALIKLSDSVDCVASLKRVRQWWHHPRQVYLSANYPETSLKSSTYDKAWGASARHWTPGGLAGSDHGNFVIGGDPGVLTSPEAARTWSEAGFLVASLHSESNITTGANSFFVRQLEWAQAFGVFVLAAPPAEDQKGVASAVSTHRLATAVSCATNFAGFVLAREANTSQHDVKLVAAALRQSAYWTWAVAPAATVPAAVALAHAGVPLPLLQVTALGPQLLTREPASDSKHIAAAWAQKTIDSFAQLALVAENASVPLTPAVSLDACALSDSMRSFAAFTSLVFGSVQQLWWHGLASDCGAQIGSQKFKGIAAVNQQLMQFAGPLFGRHLYEESAGPQGAGHKNLLPDQLHFVVTSIWSTSASLQLPMVHSNGTAVSAVAPGTRSIDLVQNMSSDLIAIHIANTTAVSPTDLPPGGDGWLLLISTRVSTAEGGSPPRDIQITMRADVQSTQPLVVDRFQGMESGCNLRLLGSAATLELGGGAAQLLGYTLPSLTPPKAVDPSYGAVGRRKARARVIDSSRWT